MGSTNGGGLDLLGRLANKILSLVAVIAYHALNPIWLHIWPPLQVVYLISKRTLLRDQNLTAPTLQPRTAIREENTPHDARTFEGSLNNQDRPTMGMAGCPFMRNTPAVPGSRSDPVEGPDPVLVSETLLARPGGATKTRPLVNLLGGEHTFAQAVQHCTPTATSCESGSAAMEQTIIKAKELLNVCCNKQDLNTMTLTCTPFPDGPCVQQCITH